MDKTDLRFYKVV